jgi:hypothetical protein
MLKGDVFNLKISPKERLNKSLFLIQANADFSLKPLLIMDQDLTPPVLLAQ